MSVPIGTIVAYGGEFNSQNKSQLERQGWLACDGDAANREEYNDLFNVIGSAFGNGDAFKTFDLPDLRGRFLRGVDHGTGRDPDADKRIQSGPDGSTGDKVGSLQEDEFKSHTHKITIKNGDRSPFDGGTEKYQSAADPKHRAASTYDPQKEGGNETRPKNIYVNWIIKAK